MITEKENELFERWEKTRPGFIADGVADETEYLRTRVKILFILKEANDVTGGGWDLRDYMRKGGRESTWNNITRWVEGIRNLPSSIPWSNYLDIDQDRRIAALKSIGAMNLKKSPGRHTTNQSELARVASEDRPFLNEQFAIYNADFVICCGTDVTNNFDSLIDIAKNSKWQVTSRGVKYKEYCPKKFVISYSHPEARCANYLLYYGLVDAVDEIIKTTNLANY